MGSGGLASRILDASTRWRWVVSFTPRPSYPQGKIPWYQLDKTTAGPQNWSGHGGKEKNSQNQQVKKDSVFYGTRRFITVFTIARHLSLCWARWIQSTTSKRVKDTFYYYFPFYA